MFFRIPHRGIIFEEKIKLTQSNRDVYGIHVSPSFLFGALYVNQL